jgi:putative transposase
MDRKDTESLAHTTWECKYHVVFAPKYRRQVIYKDIRKDIGTYCESCANTKG